nr:hypothetical protein [Helicobacter trogontum]
MLEKEQIQREQIQRDSNSIDSLTSTAMLHPILEDNELKCPHNGVVKLKSNKGKLFKSKGIPMILESDLLCIVFRSIKLFKYICKTKPLKI